MKPSVSPEQRQRVLDLRRRHSLGEVAKLTGLPLGIVKTLVSRSGAFRHNPQHRALFSLPPIRPSEETLPAVPELPPQQRVTGDAEIDAVLWLRSVIDTGNPALIDKAMHAKARLKTPLADLERRNTNHLVSANPGNRLVALGSFGFADLDGLAERAIERERLRMEGAARFGNDVLALTDAENFCVTALVGLEPDGSCCTFDEAEVAKRFKARPELMPNTLTDCLYEQAFWSDLYRLRRAMDPDSYGLSEETTARDFFVFGLMAEIRPRSKDEAMAVLRYMLDENYRMGRSKTGAILTNLIGGSSAAAAS
jgi:hypothetical protein